ncbi:LLM class flavin-dependent oxidoreductase [Kineococcus gypseus]|uniref:LLM class flavin-dependent oxidoreductase n=1 Tax=Kineococcus gypseus TaxID=1637102 RepID=UPI003D7C8254
MPEPTPDPPAPDHAPRPHPGLHLAVELDGAGRHPAAWREAGADPAGLFTSAHQRRLVALADGADLDLVLLPDELHLLPGGDGEQRGRLEAAGLAAHLAPVTRRTGLVPVVTTTHTEAFHTSKAIATLDLVSLGRAGWQVGVSATEQEAAAFGRRPVAPPEQLWDEAAEAVEVVRALWDSWEDDAVVRDVATGRYVDRAKLHHVDHAGRHLSVRGPSITPRSPQGQPLVVVPVADEPSLAAAAAAADVVRLSAPDLEEAVALAARVRAAAGQRALRVLLDVEVLLRARAGEAVEVLARLDAHRATAPRALRHVGTADRLTALLRRVAAADGLDGAVVVPLDLPASLVELTGRVVPALRAEGLRPPAGAAVPTARARFGLPRPASRYATADRTTAASDSATSDSATA